MLKKRYHRPSKYNEVVLTAILLKRFEACESMMFPFKTSLRAKGLEI